MILLPLRGPGPFGAKGLAVPAKKKRGPSGVSSKAPGTSFKNKIKIPFKNNLILLEDTPEGPLRRKIQYF